MVKAYAHRGEDNATLADLVIGRGLSCDKAELLGILDAVGYYRFKGYLVLRPPFTPIGKLKPSYNSARSGLQGSRDPLTGEDVHLGRPLSPVSRKNPG